MRNLNGFKNPDFGKFFEKNIITKRKNLGCRIRVITGKDSYPIKVFRESFNWIKIGRLIWLCICNDFLLFELPTA